MPTTVENRLKFPKHMLVQEQILDIGTNRFKPSDQPAASLDRIHLCFSACV
jgi:hypothetical protein